MLSDLSRRQARTHRNSISCLTRRSVVALEEPLQGRDQNSEKIQRLVLLRRTSSMGGSSPVLAGERPEFREVQFSVPAVPRFIHE